MTNETTIAKSNDNRPRPIPIPKGGFRSNADEARWLEQTILLRLHEVLYGDDGGRVLNAIRAQIEAEIRLTEARLGALTNG